MEIAEIKEKLTALNLIPNGQPVTLKEFRERINANKYGKKSIYIIFIGEPKQNLFGFYPEISTKAQAIKDAYESYCRLVNGDIHDFEDEYVSWGDSGIPLSYARLRVRNFVQAV